MRTEESFVALLGNLVGMAGAQSDEGHHFMKVEMQGNGGVEKKTKIEVRNTKYRQKHLLLWGVTMQQRSVLAVFCNHSLGALADIHDRKWVPRFLGQGQSSFRIPIDNRF